MIERFAPIASAETSSIFEQWLLSYAEPDLLETYQWRHEGIERDGDLDRPSWFGRTPHVLLPMLPQGRLSLAGKHRIAELGRKFGAQLYLDTAERVEDEGGFGGSPLRQESVALMSDQALFKLASNRKLQRGRRNPRWTERGDYREASTATMSTNFHAGARDQPERFARLLTQWPEDGHQSFVVAILSGLAYPDDRKGGHSAEE